VSGISKAPPPLLDVAYWLSPDWRCVLRKLAASQVYSIYFDSRRRGRQTWCC